MKVEALLRFLIPLIFLSLLNAKPLLENKFIALEQSDNSPMTGFL